METEKELMKNLKTNKRTKGEEEKRIVNLKKKKKNEEMEMFLKVGQRTKCGTYPPSTRPSSRAKRYSPFAPWELSLGEANVVIIEGPRERHGKVRMHEYGIYFSFSETIQFPPVAKGHRERRGERKSTGEERKARGREGEDERKRKMCVGGGGAEEKDG
ncbi:hypothetical protein niasHT_026407 [Heterodera trifolii]|uniref:Uncharacterized protein n=1 Tax=Heterodera trifolii TaxID=157864 RepID=A0ABD2JBK9_9BILA